MGEVITIWNFLRTVVGITAIVGFLLAIVLLMRQEWRRIRDRKFGFVPMFHRIRRLVTGGLMVILLGFCFYGWWFLGDSISLSTAEVYLKSVFSLLVVILASLVWDGISVYQSMDSFFNRVNRSNQQLIEEAKREAGQSGNVNVDEGTSE